MKRSQARPCPLSLPDFFGAFFQGGGFIELRALPGAARAFVRTGDPTPAGRFLAAHREEDVYFGVAARRDSRGGALADCLHLGALFADIDFKRLPEADARERLREFLLPPSLIVRSGGGVHIYWLLQKAVELPAEAARAKDLLGRLAHALGGDLNAAEPARILRVPWTRNWKYDPPRRVILELFEPERRYDLWDFEPLLPPALTNDGGRFALPEKIVQTTRNDTLYRLGRSLKAKGATQTEILAALAAVNTRRCQPPLPEDEIEKIARNAVTQADQPTFTSGASSGSSDGHHDHRRLILTPLGELLAEPEETTSWLVDRHLPVGGLSLLSGKPKAGKSTLARCLALAVARGTPWLGLSTAPGAVFYLALEEKRAEVRRHFRAMGASWADPIEVFIAPSPQDGLAQLRQATEKDHPALVIVDPLFKLVRLKDGNDYAEVTRALEPLLLLARETAAHVLAVHHLGKGERSGGDAILGSTAIFAAVDTALLLKRSDRYRTLSSIQRYGEDLEEMVLTLDPVTRIVSAGPTRSEADEAQAADAILEYLQTKPEGVEEVEIHDAIEGRRSTKVKALRVLLERAKVSRSGGGKRGDPYRYYISGSLVPVYMREPANENPKKGVSVDGESTYSGSRKISLLPEAPEAQEPESEASFRAGTELQAAAGFHPCGGCRRLTWSSGDRPLCRECTTRGGDRV